ncbi:hypothetical protein [Photobacterium toruni]|uniref:hypothetical protein n=1 Tax=Photobacterium toruni TaxID=1935446 RepID=UPI002110D611|nr:hypothetical protein [Photobacterium toruni]
MSQNEALTKKSNTPKPVSTISVIHKLWIALGVIFALSACGGVYVYKSIQALEIQLNDSQQKLVMTMDYVTQLQKDIPKIKVIDFSLMAQDWANTNQASAMNAMDAVIKSYNNKGYVLIKSDSIVGNIKPLLVRTPKPHKIK